MADKTLSINEKLSLIQQEIKAPKNLRNSFGNYNYRNAEGILEAVKPYEKKYRVALTLDDNIEVYADKVYVRAVATLIDLDSEHKIVTSAFAREPLTKKGMDDSQITGASSSYARKYALNGLFLLDDTKDADTDEYRVQNDAMEKKQREEDAKALSDLTAMINEVYKVINNRGIDEKFVANLYKVKSIKDFDMNKCDNVIKHIEELQKKWEDSKNE